MNFCKAIIVNIVLNAEVFQISKPACTLLAKTLGANYFVRCIFVW